MTDERGDASILSPTQALLDPLNGLLRIRNALRQPELPFIFDRRHVVDINPCRLLLILEDVRLSSRATVDLDKYQELAPSIRSWTSMQKFDTLPAALDAHGGFWDQTLADFRASFESATGLHIPNVRLIFSEFCNAFARHLFDLCIRA